MPKKKKTKAKKRRSFLSNTDQFALAMAILLTLCAMFINMFTNLMHETAMQSGGWFYTAYMWFTYIGTASVSLILWLVFRRFIDDK